MDPAALRVVPLQLVCLGAEGVTTVEMIFDPPVRNPAELWRRLAATTAAG